MAGQTREMGIADPKKRILLNILKGKVRATTREELRYNVRDGSVNTFQIRGKTAVTGHRGSPLEPATLSAAGPDGKPIAANIQGTAPALGLFENSPAYFGAYIDFPAMDAEAASFDFAFLDLGDGDWLEVTFNGQVIWSSVGQVLEPQVVYTAEINPALVSNQSGFLFVQLHSVGAVNAQVVLPDFQQNIGAVDVPTLSEWAMILFSLILAGGAALVIQRRQFAA